MAQKMISSVNSTAMSVDDDEQQEMTRTKYSLDVPSSAMNNSTTTSDKNSLRNVFSTVNARNLFCAVKAKRKYDKKPRANCDLGMVSFFVEVDDQQYFDHLQLREVLLKLIPCRTYLLLFEKRNIKEICKLHMIFVTNKRKDGLKTVVTVIAYKKASREGFHDTTQIQSVCIVSLDRLTHFCSVSEFCVSDCCFRPLQQCSL